MPPEKFSPATLWLVERIGLAAPESAANVAMWVARLSAGAIPPVQLEPEAKEVPLVELQVIAVCAKPDTVAKAQASAAFLNQKVRRFMSE